MELILKLKLTRESFARHVMVGGQRSQRHSEGALNVVAVARLLVIMVSRKSVLNVMGLDVE